MYVALVLGLTGTNLLMYQHPVGEGVNELVNYVLFFSLVAAAASGGPQWLIAQVVLWFVWTMTLSQTNPLYNSSGEGIALLEFGSPPVWQTVLFTIYWSVSALLRLGALVEVETLLAHSPRERWGFRIMILAHVGMWLSALAIPHVLAVSGYDAAVLLLEMIIVVVYCLTPLMLVHFLVLNQATARCAVVLFMQ